MGLVVFALFGTAFGQSTISGTRVVATNNARVQLEIDGQLYYTPQTFLWPSGSKHTLRAFNSELNDVTGTTHYEVGGFTTNLGGCPSVCTFTAHPDVPEITAAVAVSYLVRVNFATPGPGGVCVDSPGSVTVAGAVFNCSGQVFVAEGPVALSAIPNPGWVFVGWETGTNAASQSFVSSSIVINAPIGIYPKFVRARPMSFLSVPAGLQILVDRQSFNTPVVNSLQWGWGTTHTLGALPDQVDQFGKLWVFDFWSDGGAINHAYVVPDGVTPLPVTANFVPGQRVSFFTNPPGLTLTVDGRSNWLSNNFAWAVNSQHQVSAPLTQVDENGTRYTFRSWSNGGDSNQLITATQDPSGLNLQYTANYDASGRISVISQTPGLAIQVDGQRCDLPCVIEKTRGTAVRLTAPASLQLTDDSRLDFDGWGDSASLDRTVNSPAGPMTINLKYRLRNRLSAGSTPPEGARVTTEPAGADGFYDAQSDVVVSIDTKLGFKFHNWDGDVYSTSRTITLNMNAPKNLRAILDRVPALRDGAVKNAAGDTPIDAVAAGSIVSIYGASLAPGLKIGPANPLTQTLYDVTVRAGGRLIPLLFVAPDQINAQLPSDMADGLYTLTVRSEGNPEVSTTFRVARNAPGLFNNVVDGRPYGLVLHENGDAVTSDSPARRSEVLTLLGTGFGPYRQTPPDGFAVPESDSTALADTVSILSADRAIDPIYAGLAAGRVGVTAIRFKIGDKLPGGGSAEIRVRVANQESNTVLLPVE